MTTIFEKSNNINGISFFEGEEKVNFIDEKFLRKGDLDLPQTSELEVLRHYKKLSHKNFSIENAFNTLGTLTIK